MTETAIFETKNLENPSFNSLGLAPELLKALTESGYTTPTPIQAQAIPVALAGDRLNGRCANRHR